MFEILHKVVNELKFRNPPSRDWKLERQTNPPTFGWAQRVSQNELETEIQKRRDDCLKIIQNTNIENFVPGKVSLVVLSCRRWWTFKRLLKTATPYFKNIETYSNIEKILVDNDSGPEMIENVKEYKFFDKIIQHETNLGMVGALKDIFSKVDGEYILFFEDDFVVDHPTPFINKCMDIFNEYPEIGIIRLKNQNNWWKPFRRISPLRKTSKGDEFWTWLPSRNGEYNVWAAGSVMFRRVSYTSTGELEDAPHVKRTNKKLNHAHLYENVYGKRYNKKWLAAKIKNCCPFIQPNDNQQSPGWE
ncbi:glycosyltransferase [Bacteriovoracaceae bacterium]|nr:glycosyltransferase [Bacteriovoracaceae bacterium]